MEAALAAGVRFFQYRSKYAGRREIFLRSRQLASRARQTGSLFVVNDHADIAAAAGADGVHLGQDDLPLELARKILGRDGIVGVSTHSREQACTAERGGADYIGFGPVFKTATKDAGLVQGLDAIRIIKDSVSLPVIAIGGIDHDNAFAVIKAGADGVAVISAVLCAPDIGQAAEAMVRKIAGSRISQGER